MARLEILFKTIAANTVLQHVSRMIYEGTPLYFNRGKGSRYDDPIQVYGVLYLGFDLNTGVMESIFHKHQWSRSARTISTDEVAQRMVRIIGTKHELRLANITSEGIMAPVLGLNLSQLISRQYGHTQRLSAYVHRHMDADAQKYDGVLYPSRSNYPANCIALFDRVAAKSAVQRDIALACNRDWPDFVEQHKARIIRI